MGLLPSSQVLLCSGQWLFAGRTARTVPAWRQSLAARCPALAGAAARDRGGVVDRQVAVFAAQKGERRARHVRLGQGARGCCANGADRHVGPAGCSASLADAGAAGMQLGAAAAAAAVCEASHGITKLARKPFAAAGRNARTRAHARTQASMHDPLLQHPPEPPPPPVPAAAD